MTKNQIENAIKALPAKSPKDLSHFIPSFLSEVPAEDLNQLDSKDIVALSQIHYALMKSLKDGVHHAIKITSITDTSKKGWDSRGTLIDIVTTDRAFLVDSVSAYLTSENYVIDLFIHSRLNQGEKRLSHMHIRVRGALAEQVIEEIKTDLIFVLKDVEDSTRDWQAMKQKIRSAQTFLTTAPKSYDPKELSEWKDFLDYMHDDNFTFLGYREYRMSTQGKVVTSEIVKGSGLGLLADQKKPAYINDQQKTLPADLQKLRTTLPPLNISKVNRISTVHRRVPLDAVSIKKYDDKGRVVGEVLFIGLFTSVTYSRSLRSIPFLRYKSEIIINRARYESGSHNSRALRHILEKYPRDEMFQITVDQLEKICLSILRLQERQRIALYVRRDPFGRYVSCLVYVPRERFETRLRLTFQDILEKSFNGKCTNFYSTIDDSPLVRVMYVVAVPQGQTATASDEQIERQLQNAGRLWGDSLSEALHNKLPDDEAALKLAHKYATAFSSDYRKTTKAEHAVKDILKVEEVSVTRKMALDFYQTPISEKTIFNLKIFNPLTPVPLSDILPILENMGLRVLSEQPYEVRLHQNQEAIWIQDFSLQIEQKNAEIDIQKIKPLFEEALLGVWSNFFENDQLNRLTILASLPARAVMALRGYIRYLRLTNLPFSLNYIEQALTDHPQIAQNLLNLFVEKFNPRKSKEKSVSQESLLETIRIQLEAVTSLDQDRILRALLSLIENTLRTNAFQKDSQGYDKPYISYKLAAANLSILPNPKPFREIFVYAPFVEGVHLRGDRIARGGLRWSDRHEDFRTEILGLMKAQTVKNAVIIPMGAKGGFIVKQPPKEGGKAAYQQEGIRCYQTFIRGLLDITDNRVGKKIIPPQMVIRYDEDDPYLVVAADKGTATFSDIANALSLEYGFWMGDAFASGGSAGYDHKKMGITARGAWESVKRHFRELNHDTQTKAFDVTGVGDMGGDVFGNGLLQSPFIRLIAAFNHLHIFCDPNPDPAISFIERQRLFDGVLGWDQYDKTKLSKGGRIYLRSEKVLNLTPEIMARLDLAKDKVTPVELMQAILKARTNLLFFGGIGTYIKASTETHADAGDKSNDSLRIDSGELRARVIGEGANLGMTQRARIECAAKGVKLNTDFIDNSAGVDTSDHEVNIKILFYQIMAQKDRLTLAQRNTVLKKMTDDIAKLVLNDNYQQTQALSLIEMRSAERLTIHQQLIEALEHESGLNRKLEALPTNAEIAERLKRGQGLYRPELCTLLSYAKITLTRYILESDIPDDLHQQHWLYAYFPSLMQKEYTNDIAQHPLKREIIATAIANMILNRMGTGFIMTARTRLDGNTALATRAFLAIHQILNLEEVWKQIEALDGKVSAAVQYKSYRAVARYAEALTFWLIENKPDLITDIKQQNHFADTLSHMRTVIGDLIVGDIKLDRNQYLQSCLHDGLPKSLAEYISLLPVLERLIGLVLTPVKSFKELTDFIKAYIEVGELSGIEWLRLQMRTVSIDGPHAARLQESLFNDLIDIQKDFANRSLKAGKNQKQEFSAIQSLKKQGQIDLAGLIVTIQDLKSQKILNAAKTK